jgi:hypothetical protein
MLLHIFGHIDANEVFVRYKDFFSQGASQLGFTDDCRTKEEEDTGRTFAPVASDFPEWRLSR